MQLPDTAAELEALIEDLQREIDDHPLMPDAQRQAVGVQILKATSRLAGLGVEPQPDHEPEQEPGSDDDRVRAWARSRGFECPSSGKLPTALHDAYSAAEQGDPA